MAHRWTSLGEQSFPEGATRLLALELRLAQKTKKRSGGSQTCLLAKIARIPAQGHGLVLGSDPLSLTWPSSGIMRDRCPCQFPNSMVLAMRGEVSEVNPADTFILKELCSLVASNPNRHDASIIGGHPMANISGAPYLVRSRASGIRERDAL